MPIKNFKEGKIAVVCFNKDDAKRLSELCQFSLDTAPWASENICYFCDKGKVNNYSFENIPDIVMCKIYSFTRFLGDIGKCSLVK